MAYAARNTICFGAFFLSSSTLRLSCYSIIHNFVRWPALVRDHEPAAWALLCRLVHFYYMVFLRCSYPLDKCEPPLRS